MHENVFQQNNFHILKRTARSGTVDSVNNILTCKSSLGQVWNENMQGKQFSLAQ